MCTWGVVAVVKPLLSPYTSYQLQGQEGRNKTPKDFQLLGGVELFRAHDLGSAQVPCD